MRAYCWRVGLVIDIEPGKPCDECGNPNHAPYEGDDCGNYVEVAGGRGSPCVLPPGHPGRCALDRDKIAEEIHDS